MKIVGSFSGGRTSAFSILKLIDRFGVENVDTVYMDTGAEHPKTYKFIKEFHEFLITRYGKGVTLLRIQINPELGKGNSYVKVDHEDIGYDLKPFKDMMEKYGVPYTGGMFCTDRMKLQVFKNYCKDTYGEDNYQTWLGIRCDEPKRIWGDHKQKKYSVSRLMLDADYDSFEMTQLWRAMSETYLSIENVSELVGGDKWLAKLMIKRYYDIRILQEIHYIAEIADLEKEDILEFWSKMPFDLEIPEWLGNCVFCPKKSDLKLAAAQRDEPELYLQYLEALHHEDVRIDNNTGNRNKMYRGETSLEGVIARFDGLTGNEIKARIKGAHMIDTGSCSESCEVFSCAL